MLQNEYLIVKIGVDTAENEPSKVWYLGWKSEYHSIARGGSQLRAADVGAAKLRITKGVGCYENELLMFGTLQLCSKFSMFFNCFQSFSTVFKCFQTSKFSKSCTVFKSFLKNLTITIPKGGRAYIPSKWSAATQPTHHILELISNKNTCWHYLLVELLPNFSHCLVSLRFIFVLWDRSITRL